MRMHKRMGIEDGYMMLYANAEHVYMLIMLLKMQQYAICKNDVNAKTGRL